MFYSSDQEWEAQQELLGDGYSNEFQRVYAQSAMQHPLRDERALAAQLHAAGRVVVVAALEVCCPVTDGLIGCDYLVVGNFATRIEALTYLGDCDQETRFIYEPAPAAAVEPTQDDQCPF